MFHSKIEEAFMLFVLVVSSFCSGVLASWLLWLLAGVVASSSRAAGVRRILTEGLKGD